LIGYWLIGYWFIGYWFIGYWLLVIGLQNRDNHSFVKKRTCLPHSPHRSFT